MAAVAPFRPGRQPRQVQPNLSKEGRPVNCVERVVEIYLQEDVGGMSSSTVHPLPGRVHGGLSAQGHCNPNLEGGEQVLSRVPHCLA